MLKRAYCRLPLSWALSSALRSSATWETDILAGQLFVFFFCLRHSLILLLIETYILLFSSPYLLGAASSLCPCFRFCRLIVVIGIFSWSCVTLTASFMPDLASFIGLRSLVGLGEACFTGINRYTAYLSLSVPSIKSYYCTVQLQYNYSISCINNGAIGESYTDQVYRRIICDFYSEIITSIG